MECDPPDDPPGSHSLTATLLHIWCRGSQYVHDNNWIVPTIQSLLEAQRSTEYSSSHTCPCRRPSGFQLMNFVAVLGYTTSPFFF